MTTTSHRSAALLLALLVAPARAPGVEEAARLRLIVETDAGGDPDDEQSLVRFLLYTCEWDVEGIIANRREARDGENLNSRRTGLEIVRGLVEAYGECWPRLSRHDPRYPPPARLLERTVSGYQGAEDGVERIIAAVDAPDSRPVWFLNWGTDHGADPSSLRRALDRVLRERGQEGYARFKKRILLSSDDQFGDHTTRIDPPFPIWVDTFRPEIERRRWYHRFSSITARAGGFDLERDVRTGHGPLGALYPVNTDRPQKEGDTMTFLYLVPTGMNDPLQPGWGSWAGRYAPRKEHPGRPCWWAEGVDAWNGTRHRDNSLIRWAEPIQNDFRARMDWCVMEPARANHPPRVALAGPARRAAKAGEEIALDVSASSDPDGHALRFRWIHYPEPGDWRGPDLEIRGADLSRATVTVPSVEKEAEIHLVAAVTDAGDPPLTRYARVVVRVAP